MKSAIDRRKVSLFVTDLDNTLWDWFEAWYGAFSPFLQEVSRISGVPHEQLEREIQRVHQANHTSEYTLLLQELPSLRKRWSEKEVCERFSPAIHTYRTRRLSSTRLYPSVLTTLEEVKRLGVPIVGYTESNAYISSWRVRRTGLDGLMNVLYSAPDYGLPAGASRDQLRTQEAEHYDLQRTLHRPIDGGVSKPNPEILKRIIKEMEGRPETTLYVGDSLDRDVAMAQAAGAIDVHALYGTYRREDEYELLRRVSHWPSEDVERERDFRQSGEVQPSYTLTERMMELLQVFDFAGPHV